MKVLIIEDEVPAAEKLERYLKRYDESIEVLNKIDSVKDSVEWLSDHQSEVDLIFMDIQLIDGKSFEIFRQIEIKKPIIFITAFDEFAIDAFKVNSIDYLLKPITFDDLSTAINKLNSMRQNLGTQAPDGLKHLYNALNQLTQSNYKNRFMVKLGEHIKTITIDKIELFFAEGRNVYLVTNENRKFIIDFKLEDLEELLNPQNFYRVNRSFIINIDSIKDVLVYSNSRLKIVTNLDFDKEIIVSRDKVNPFKEWLSGS